MPKIVPALLSGVIAGLVMGPLACVVAVRLAPGDSAEAGSSDASRAPASSAPSSAATAEANSAANPPTGSGLARSLERWAEDTWLGRLADVAVRFGPPAAAETFLLVRPERVAEAAPIAAAAGWPAGATALEASGTVPEEDAADAADAAASRGEADDAFAVLALRRLERGGIVLLEREVVFEQEGIRVLHTERIDGDRRRLVWREFLPGGTRSWMAEWSVDGSRAQTIAYGWHRPVHEWIDVEPGTVGPLELLDELRRSPRDGSTRRTVIEASAHSATTVDANVFVVDEGSGAAAMEVRRADGTLLFGARTSAAASDLDELRLADGGATCAPVAENEFHRRRKRWTVEVVPAHEAVLARIPRRQ